MLSTIPWTDINDQIERLRGVKGECVALCCLSTAQSYTQPQAQVLGFKCARW